VVATWERVIGACSAYDEPGALATTRRGEAYEALLEEESLLRVEPAPTSPP
jgi:hypothetical protein